MCVSACDHSTARLFNSSCCEVKRQGWTSISSCKQVDILIFKILYSSSNNYCSAALLLKHQLSFWSSKYCFGEVCCAGIKYMTRMIVIKRLNEWKQLASVKLCFWSTLSFSLSQRCRSFRGASTELLTASLKCWPLDWWQKLLVLAQSES